MNEEVLAHWGLSRRISKSDADNSLLDAKIYFRNKPLFHDCVWDKYRPLVDAFYVVGTVHLYKYWPLICYPQVVSKSGTSKRKNPIFFVYVIYSFLGDSPASEI